MSASQNQVHCVVKATGGAANCHVLIKEEAGLSFEMNRLVGTMRLRPSSLLWFTILGGLAANPAVAQIAPMGIPAPPPVAKTPKPKAIAPDAPVPGNPDFQADQQGQPAPAVPPPLPPIEVVPYNTWARSA